MRNTEASGWIVRSSSRASMHALRPGALSFGTALFGAALFGVALGIGLVMTAGPARAQDAEADQRSFSEKFVDGFKSAIRGTTMDNRGIDYRERSPLVVPPNLDLPPPAAASAPQVTNWPKDPDERQRKAIIAAKKKTAPHNVAVAASQAPGQGVAETAAGGPNALPPVVITAGAAPVAEATPPATVTTRPAYANDSNGTARIDPVYDQAGDLFNGGAAAEILPSGVADTLGLDNLSGLFGSSSKKKQTLPPGTEPTREALTQPPSGYQTPSPNYPYAVAPRGFFGGEANPDHNPAAQMSSASSVVH